MDKSRKPVAKVTAGAVGGALSTLVVAALSSAGVQVDPTVAAALATVLGFAAGYLKSP